MLKTPDLSKEFYPQPKVYKAKKSPKGIGKGTKVKAWEEGRKDLKIIFRENGITTCEFQLKGCKSNNFLGFAHKRRRNTLTPEETISSRFVILACQSCHEIIDQKTEKGEAERLMDKVIENRGW